jgi:phosphoglycerate dehydrogenase-like enzyme
MSDTKRGTVTVLDDYQQVALRSADWAPVRELFDIDVITEHIADPDELVSRLQDSQVVVAMRERTPLPAAVLGTLPNLRLLVTTGMVNAAIDLKAAHQHTIGPGLAGHTLGIVGLGRLGVPVARLAQAFDMTVIAWSPHLTAERAQVHGVRAVDKAALFAESDVVTIHMPLSDASRGLIGADELARMKPTAYLINTSRGPIVDEAALLAALRERRIAGAGLDVYDTEPLPPEHPLRSLSNTLLLPHIGYVTTDTYRTWFAQVVENIVAWADGQPVRVL